MDKTPESPLDSKEIKPINPKGNQSWILIGRTDAEAEAPIIWPPHMKSQLIGKDPDAGKYWGQEERGNCRRWDGWMALPTQWTWVGANSGREWRTAMSGMLQSMGSQRIRHDLVTDQQKSLLTFCLNILSIIECGLRSLQYGRTDVSFSLQFCQCSLYTCRWSVIGWIYL